MIWIGAPSAGAADEPSPPSRSPQGGTPQSMSCNAELPPTAMVRQTPRDDARLELLALTLSPSIVAEQAIYDRLQRDLQAIHHMKPAIRNVSFRPDHDGRTLLVTVSAAERARFASNTDSPLNCLNTYLGVSNQDWLSDSLLRVELKGRYDLSRLALIYRRVQGVTQAAPDWNLGHGPSISVTRERHDWHYVFDAADGDCMAGCSRHHLYYTVTSPGKPPVPVIEWNSTGTAPLPNWARDYWRRPR
jgi:hypothetical protein